MILRKPFLIAVDGPAASGKGTLCRKLQEIYKLPYLDTGLTYRAIGYYLLNNNLPLDDENIAVNAALEIDLKNLDRKLLSQHHIGEAASKIATMAPVRQALVMEQRKFAKSGQGAILDGRDIGTVVLPDADVKLFITASPQTRAQRRYMEIVQREGNIQSKIPPFEQILQEITLRDERDMSRKDSPLHPAKDAILIDTTKMDIEQALSTAVKAIEDAN